MRCKVLDLAAVLDRLDRAGASGSSLPDDARVQNLHAAIRVLLEGESRRAERIQMIFSDSYDSGWQRPAARTKS
jgi:hypothetical protein